MTMWDSSRRKDYVVAPEGRSGWWTDCGENLERVPNINSGLEFSVGTVRYEWNGVGPID